MNVTRCETRAELSAYEGGGYEITMLTSGDGPCDVVGAAIVASKACNRLT